MADEARAASEQALRLGTVPLVIRLCPADVTAKQPPLPCCYNVPRASLLACLWESVMNAFTPSVASFGQTPPLWLMTKADDDVLAAGGPAAAKVAPLPWHVPVGALVDSRAAVSPHTGHLTLPFELVAHMGPLPPKMFPWRMSKRKDAEILAQQMLKQGLMARFKGLRAFYKANPADIANFVEGALAIDARDHKRDVRGRAAAESMFKVGRAQCVAEKITPHLPIVMHRGPVATTVLIETPFTSDAAAELERANSDVAMQPEAANASEGAAAPEDEGNDDGKAARTLEASADGSPSPARDQRPAASGAASPVNSSSGRKASIEDVAAASNDSTALPPVVSGPGPSTEHAHEATLTLAHAIAACLTDAERAEPGCNLGPNVSLRRPPEAPFQHPRLRVIVNGVEPYLSTPLAWAMQHLVYADVALHVVVRPRDRPTS